MRRILHGEQKFAYHRYIYAGDRLTLTTTTSDIYSKKGGALEFVVQDTQAVNDSGVLCVEMTTVTVIRNG
jgi:N-terminal half of MaoC dehydratase